MMVVVVEVQRGLVRAMNGGRVEVEIVKGGVMV